MTEQGQESKRVGMYLRLSTSEQTTDNQRRELIAVAERHGWWRDMVARRSLGTNWRLIYFLHEQYLKEQIGCGSLSRQSCLQYHSVLASARLWHAIGAFLLTRQWIRQLAGRSLTIPPPQFDISPKSPRHVEETAEVSHASALGVCLCNSPNHTDAC